ncbi:MAG: TolC family outer membrane protein [Hyphomicrobiales bacterium]|nr:TolC family outer membrane protein [Hyphomicrobiales bacterium]
MRPTVMLGRMAFAATAVLCISTAAKAETISGALAKAYNSNPDLNVQRAGTRATDENINRAKAGYLPTVNLTASLGLQHLDSNTLGRASVGTMPRSVGLSIQQNLFNGFRTRNGVRQSESQILQSREQLRLIEQTILANGAAAYMNVLRDTAILNLRRNNITVLQQQLRQTQDRFQVGEVTRTDVAQSEAALAQGQSDALVAQTQLQNSLAVYRQVIGSRPRRLAPARPVTFMLPKSQGRATSVAYRQHPAVVAALHNADAMKLAVKIAEGALYPSVNVTGSIQKAYESGNIPGSRALQSSIIASLNVPLYSGGLNYANIRQAKEQYGQARLQVDVQRAAVRAAVVSAWGVWQASQQVIRARQVGVRAAEVALNGVREEAKVGQRTTLDVLNAQQALLNARVQLVTAQRDRVVASYSLLAAVGKLSARNLRLKVRHYNPVTHFDQVKNKLWGVRTPDGR